MIDVIKQTPEIYSDLSRDYQILARLFTAAFNSSKSYADNMHVWLPNIDNKLSELRAKTLNFQTKHQWDYDALDAASSCFKYLMRKKGTIIALEYCIAILMRTYKLSGAVSIEKATDEFLYTLKLPTQLATLGVVQDLLDYILPAGISYRIIQYKLLDYGLLTQIKANENITRTNVDTETLGIYNGSTDSSSSEAEYNQGYRIYRNAVSDLQDEDTI